MPTMGDKLREARRTYALLAEEAERLERAAALARREFMQLRKERQEAVREARQQREAVRRDAEALRRALRKPWQVLAAYGAATAFLGSLSYWAARDFLSWLVALLRPG